MQVTRRCILRWNLLMQKPPACLLKPARTEQEYVLESIYPSVASTPSYRIIWMERLLKALKV